MRRPACLARFNPRLHPLLAAGMGLALVALFAPAPARQAESHSKEEILARLVSPEPDLDHGPVFWLAEIQEGSDLFREAQERCRVLGAPSSPGCELLTSLERLVQTLAPPALEALAQTLDPREGEAGTQSVTGALAQPGPQLRSVEETP